VLTPSSRDVSDQIAANDTLGRFVAAGNVIARRAMEYSAATRPNKTAS
jgi:hypothetical protein